MSHTNVSKAMSDADVNAQGKPYHGKTMIFIDN
jgi:hypothetical protein